MKTFNYILLISLLICFGCDDYLDVNEDPNVSVLDNLAPKDLLPTSIFNTSEAYYQIAVDVCQYSQQLASYFSPGTDTQEEIQILFGWRAIYLDALSDIKALIILAERDNSPHYLGIAKILQAANLGLATDQWGDIPFSEGLAGEANFTPMYDSQQEIYETINSLLDEGIALLQETDTSGLTIGDDDMVYRGDLTNWIKLGYSLKTKYAIHLTEVDQQTAIANVLDNVANAFETNEDDFQLIYNTRNFNPWYREVVLPNNTGNLSVLLSDQLVSMMNGTTFPFTTINVDPRLELFGSLSENETELLGAINGSEGVHQFGATPDDDNISATADLGAEDFYSSQTAPLVMMSYAELKFIEAEALFLQNGGNETSVGTTQQAYNAYLDGIMANMNKLGISGADSSGYTADTSVGVGAGNLTLALIMREKNIATFLNAESFVDLRRYDFDPNVFIGLELPVNHEETLNGQWARRAQYPSTEETRNREAVESARQPSNVGVWWDRD